MICDSPQPAAVSLSNNENDFLLRFLFFSPILQASTCTNPWPMCASCPAQLCHLSAQSTVTPLICPSPWLSASWSLHPASSPPLTWSRPSTVSSQTCSWTTTLSNASMGRCATCSAPHLHYRNHLILPPLPHLLQLHLRCPKLSLGNRSSPWRQPNTHLHQCSQPRRCSVNINTPPLWIR